MLYTVSVYVGLVFCMISHSSKVCLPTWEITLSPYSPTATIAHSDDWHIPLSIRYQSRWPKADFWMQWGRFARTYTSCFGHFRTYFTRTHRTARVFMSFTQIQTWCVTLLFRWHGRFWGRIDVLGKKLYVAYLVLFAATALLQHAAPGPHTAHQCTWYWDLLWASIKTSKIHIRLLGVHDSVFLTPVFRSPLGYARKELLKTGVKLKYRITNPKKIRCGSGNGFSCTRCVLCLVITCKVSRSEGLTSWATFDSLQLRKSGKLPTNWGLTIKTCGLSSTSWRSDWPQLFEG